MLLQKQLMEISDTVHSFIWADKLDLEGDAAIIGFLYAIPALCYACSAYPTGTLTDKFGPAKLQFFGATAVAISFCLIGPIHPIYSRVKDSRGALWAFQIVGLVILGVGYCGVSVPSFPSVIGTLSIYGSSGKDLAAALLNAANSIGKHTIYGYCGILLYRKLLDDLEEQA